MSIKHWETPEAQALIERFVNHPVTVLHREGFWYAQVAGAPLYHIPPYVALCVLRDRATNKLTGSRFGVMWVQSSSAWVVFLDRGEKSERAFWYADQDEALLAALQKATI